MSGNTRKKTGLLRNSAIQTVIGSLLCILIGLLIGYIVLLIINPGGAWKAIMAIMKNFLYYPSPVAAMKYLLGLMAMCSYILPALMAEILPYPSVE